MENKKDTQVTVYQFKKGIIWIAWLLERRTPVERYADNNSTISVEPDSNIIYLTFSLSLKTLNKRILKFVEKYYPEKMRR